MEISLTPVKTFFPCHLGESVAYKFVWYDDITTSWHGTHRTLLQSHIFNHLDIYYLFGNFPMDSASQSQQMKSSFPVFILVYLSVRF